VVPNSGNQPVPKREILQAYVQYLAAEEQRERELFGLGEEAAFVPEMESALAAEEPVVLRSARKNA